MKVVLNGQLLGAEIIEENSGKLNNLGSLAKGVYLLQIVNTDGQMIEVKKLIKIN